MSQAVRDAALMCNDLSQAEKEWKMNGKLLASKALHICRNNVQSLGGESGVRALNDEIHQLILDRAVWEARILELGGPNHAARKRRLDARNGYVYYGSAIPFEGQWTPTSTDA